MVSVFDSFTTLEWEMAKSKWKAGRSIASEQEAEAAHATLVQLLLQMSSGRSWGAAMDVVLMLQSHKTLCP